MTPLTRGLAVIGSLIVTPLIWLLYGAGHFAWLICDNWNPSAADDDPAAPNPRLFSATFRVYQSGMSWSYRVQEWAEQGTDFTAWWLPWQRTEKQRYNWAEGNRPHDMED